LAGADIIAPSGMMDGFVQAIRAGLDEAGASRYTTSRMPLGSFGLLWSFP